MPYIYDSIFPKYSIPLINPKMSPDLNSYTKLPRGELKRKKKSLHIKQQKAHIELFHCLEKISKNRGESRPKSILSSDKCTFQYYRRLCLILGLCKSDFWTYKNHYYIQQAVGIYDYLAQVDSLGCCDNCSVALGMACSEGPQHSQSQVQKCTLENVSWRSRTLLLSMLTERYKRLFTFKL